MPITFRVDSTRNLIQSKATGTIDYADIVNHLKAKADVPCGYAELFDARNTVFDLSIQDLHRVAEQVRLATETTDPGPVAVVTNSNFIRGLAQTYATITIKDNPAFEVFGDMDEASAWIADVPRRCPH